jgi:hypothetical protein
MSSAIPPRAHALLEQAFTCIVDLAERRELRAVAGVVVPAVWQRWLASRPPEDNRPEHEFVVLQATLQIAEAGRLPLEEKRRAVAVVFLHDTHFIPRITEWQIRSAEAAAEQAAKGQLPTADELRRHAADLARQREEQRDLHMRGGADNARLLLPQLRHPNDAARPLFSAAEIERVADIIRHHDDWKLGRPHPPGSDSLAVACLEGDALWPLHPLGVLADLERPDELGHIRDVSNPREWRTQLQHSVQTLRKYRGNWHGTGERFQDEASIFRTAEGHRQYAEWLALWRM